MDSHRFGFDGIWIRCGAFRAVSTTASNRSARSHGAALRPVVVVWNRTYRGRRSGECIFRVAPRSTHSDIGARSRDRPSHYEPGPGDMPVPGPGRTGYGDLSD